MHIEQCKEFWTVAFTFSILLFNTKVDIVLNILDKSTQVDVIQNVIGIMEPRVEQS